MSTLFEEYVSRKQKEHGTNFDPSELAEQFRPYYHTGQRIKVNTSAMILTGTVGATTGWKPAFLLMRTSRSIGSPWILRASDKIIAIKQGKRYIDVR